VWRIDDQFSIDEKYENKIEGQCQVWCCKQPIKKPFVSGIYKEYESNEDAYSNAKKID
jgi:hypothetical protein